MPNQLSARNDFGIELSDVTAYHPAATAQAPPAIQGLSLSIEPGEHVAVIGPSGSGKTSLLLVIAAALKVKSGKVLLNHQSVWELATRKLQELRGNLFFAPQTPPLPPRQRVITALLAAKLPRQSFFASLTSLIYPRDSKEASEALAHLAHLQAVGDALLYQLRASHTLRRHYHGLPHVPLVCMRLGVAGHLLPA